jgi:hypothetical protein
MQDGGGAEPDEGTTQGGQCRARIDRAGVGAAVEVPPKQACAQTHDAKRQIYIAVSPNFHIAKLRITEFFI